MLNREQVQEILSKALVELFEIDPSKITLTANLYEDLEIDSIDAIDLIDHIKRKTGHRLVADDFRSVRTVGDVVEAVMKKMEENGGGGPFQLGHGIHQRIGGLGARGGVGGMVQLAPVRAPAGLDGRLHRLEDHAGCPDHGRIDHLDGSADATACLDRLTARHPRVPPRQGRCLMFFRILSGTGGPGRLLVRHDETPFAQMRHRAFVARWQSKK